MTGRPVVGVLFPGPSSDVLEILTGSDLDVRLVDWVDSSPVRRAKAEGSRSRRWIAGHEQPLSDLQRRDLAEAEVLLALDLPLELETLAPHLRWVQAAGAGVGQLVTVLAGTEIRLSSAAGVAAEPIAEFVMARLLGVWKGLRGLDELQRRRRWDPPQGCTVAGRTVSVVGTGAIGREVARRAQAFDLRLLGVRRRPELGAPEHFERVVGPDGLRDLLPLSDAVVLAAPATELTAGLIGRAELAAMPRGAVLCNVARGSLVDEVAVVEALESGHLGAAVLDVTEREPLGRRSALWATPGVYLSPHIAASWGPRYARRLMELLVDNIGRDRQGLPLQNPVDLEAGY